jgi:hypothetical protein
MGMTQLSPEARKAIVDAGCSRQGAIVPPNTVTHVLRELKVAGYIKGYGLTRKGTIAREKIVNAALESVF